MIRLDAENRVQDYTFVLSLKNHDHLGQLRNIDPNEVVSKINMNAANELSFTVYKYNEAEAAKISEKLGLSEEEALEKTKEPLWDEITDFKYVYVKELDEYYEIVVEKNEEETLYKTVTGTSACEAELSQSLIFGLEINTEADIARADYINPTVFYNEQYPDESLLHRALYKLPQYTIKHVDASLMHLQRTFSVDGTDALSFLTGEVAEEIGCLFKFDSTDRGIYVYDLMTYCVDCGHRGEFSDVCPKCGSSDLKYYGEDTTVYIDSENLAESVVLSVDTERVKNCFKLEAGDDNMTAAVVNLNPNGSSYIYYFSEEQKHDMPSELVDKLESYDALVESYTEEYEQVMADMYEAIDKVVYYTSGMMPTREDDPTNAKLEAEKLTAEAMSPMSITEVTKNTSTQTVNTALKNYAKVFVKSGYFKIDINEGEFVYEGTDSEGVPYGYWYGNFKITNYSDEEDVAISDRIKIRVDTNFDTFLDQKIKKKLAIEDEDGSIFDVLSIEDLNRFKEALTYYCFNRLSSFYDAVQGCLDIMIEMDQAHENADLYNEMYIPYYDKLLACQEEMDDRQRTIRGWETVLEEAETRCTEIQKALDFEAYLGKDLYKVFCMYKREDKFSNENYISDGLENNELFERARQFIEAAKTELVKSGEHQKRISSTLANLLCMEEFAPLKDHFKEGNFIRVGIDGEVYKLRLVSYTISFGSIQNIEVEFSDVDKIATGMSDLQSILSKASSMASSYGAVSHQVKESKKETDRMKNWVRSGLDATTVKIVNNADNQNITIDDAGLLARRMDEFTEKYEDYQVKLISNGLYTTSNAWRSVDTAIGKSYMVNPSTGELEQVFGVQAKNIVGELILGSQLGIYSQDGSAEMSFDNYGLVLNAIDNGEGHYKRILDIQKDGVSQLYIDNDGNIVLATNQMIETVESVDRLNAYYADIEKLYVSNATIEKLLAEYAKIEHLEAVEARIENLDVSVLEAEFAVIKELIATDAEIENLKAGNVTVAGKLEAAEAEIENLEATKLDVGHLDAYKIEVEKLFADYAKIDELEAIKGSFDILEADVAKFEELIADKVSVEDLQAINADIEKLNADLITVNELVADKVDAEYVEAEILKANKIIAEDINAIHATIESLDATYATIEQLNATNANIENLQAKDVEITGQLTATNAKIDNLETTNATITGKLEANEADIGKLNASVANINSIMAGNIGAGLIQTIHLTADNVVIDDAVIKSANIESIDTDLVTVGNDNIILSGSTQQFKDADGNVRIQIGLDAEDDFTFIVADKDGATIISADGITENAVPNGLIVDQMVADNAAIQANKVQYTDANGSTTLQTHLEVEQGRINALIKETTITNEDGTTTSIKDKYLDIDATVDGMKTTIADVTYDVEEMTSRMTEIEATADGISAKVSSIGGQNLFYHTTKEWLSKTDNEDYIYLGCYKETTDEDMEGKNVTLSFEIDADTETTGTFDVCYYTTSSPTTADIVTLFEGIELTDVNNGVYQKSFVYPATSAVIRVDETIPMFTVIIRVSNINGDFKIRKGMLQYGMLATQWQPTTENVEEAVSEVSIEAGKISWMVQSGSDSSNFTLTPRTAELVAEQINLKGLVTFSGLNDNVPDEILGVLANEPVAGSTTVIHGGYIQTGTIGADQINTEELVADEAFIDALNATEINADRITSGTVQASLLDLYNLRVTQRGNSDLETLYISDQGDITLRGSMASYDYVTGESGWSIQSNGDVELNNIIARGRFENADGGITDDEADAVSPAIRAWFGTSYENRENAPTIIYSDGTIKTTKGEFGGVFTGDIRIGNITITDPSNVTGNDALLTIQHGDTGVHRVQLRDTDASSFAQDIIITDNFENSRIQLKQEGTIIANHYSAGNSWMNADGLSIQGSLLTGTSTSMTIISNSFNVGTIGAESDLNVWGNATINSNSKFNGEMHFSDVVVVATVNDGLNFDFISDTLSYTVVFETNGGSAIAARTEVPAGAKIVAPANPTKSGYVFDGWYQDALFNVPFDFNSHTINRDTILYAKWTLYIPSTPTYSFTYPTNNNTSFAESSAWSGAFICNATAADGGTLSYRWRVNLYEGSQMFLSISDVFAGKTTNNITAAELQRYLPMTGGYEMLQGYVEITNTKNGATTTISTSSFTIMA